MTYAEFLEFIGRVSEMWFETTEMDDLPFYRKIEHFLERMLKLVGWPLI